MREIDMELVRVTEVAAIAAAAWVGSGNKEAADKAATDAMRKRLNGLDIAARVVIGEGKKDESYGLFEGEDLGLRAGKSSDVYEIAVDPIEGTRPTVTSGPEAISVLALGEKGSLFSTGEFYMNKLAYGPAIAEKIELTLDDSLEKTVQKVSAVTGKSASQMMVCILDRPRHEPIIKELRRIGVRIKLIQDCDVSAAIAACLPESGIDFLCGIGGAPEGVIAAAAMKCLRGAIQGQIMTKDCRRVDTKTHYTDDLVKGNCVFVATGVTDGSLLKGVRFTRRGPVTHSVFMRSESGTVRWLSVQHGN